MYGGGRVYSRTRSTNINIIYSCVCTREITMVHGCTIELEAEMKKKKYNRQ